MHQQIFQSWYKKRIFWIVIFSIVIACSIIKWRLRFSRTSQQENKYASLVFMSELERTIIRSYLNKSHSMLEYGSGYSTLYFAQFVDAYYSIEHNRQWYKKTKNLIDHSPTLSSIIKQYILAPVDPGYKGWAGGFTEGTREQFKTYIQAVHSLNITKFDRVLIDGRARTECAFEVYPFLHKDSIVFIHDYTYRKYYNKVTRKYYQLILQTYEGQTLGVFKPHIKN